MEAGLALSVVSLVWDVAKDLYGYFKTVEECEGDIESFRVQLLQLKTIAGQTVAALQRPGLAAEDRAGVQHALDQCTDAAKELRDVVDKIQASTSQAGGFRERVNQLRGRASYPLKKSTIDGLAKNTATCRIACGQAIELLGLNVGATIVEKLQRLDERVDLQFGSLANRLTNMQLTNEANVGRVNLVLNNQASQAARGNNEIDETWTRSVLARLEHHHLKRRKANIDQAYSSTLEWMLKPDAQNAIPNNALINFLKSGSGIFYIRGKPGSGKSTLMKFILQHRTTTLLLRAWAGRDAVLTPSHFFWVGGSALQRSYRGLLQSLLFQVLEADIPLAYQIIVQEQTRQLPSALTSEFWTTEVLWDCLSSCFVARKYALLLFDRRP